MMFELMPYGRRRNVTIYNPFQDFENLEKRFFEDMPIAEFKTDISDHGDSYLLEADLPGFEKGDIAIDVEGDVLTIRAERTAKNDEKDKKERSLSALRRGAFAYRIRISSGSALSRSLMKFTFTQ